MLLPYFVIGYIIIWFALFFIMIRNQEKLDTETAVIFVLAWLWPISLLITIYLWFAFRKNDEE